MEIKNPKKWWLQTEKSGIKCDNDGCDFRNDEIILNDLIKFINVPCPKCDGPIPLMTEQDFMRLLVLNKILGNPIIRFLTWIGKKCGATSKYKVEMNGQGKFELNKMN